ncbi:AEC family transporter [Clostridium sp. CCUG 7971]|uniref:AEC family transporter n=1 Tax=Clostridium sp. CCUG 7971 TaxID=2811414 RepID=UPI001ABA1C2F|nr:AEC family transporter [Clostridium sp. CCUG 7971]MBO3444160.1 AEC family transporter [Clostridium sp. CCUG 7971]
MNFRNIFMQVLVLFLLILVGYLARKKSLLDEHCTSKLSSLIMKIFLPCTIISSMQIDYSSDMIGKIINLLIISVVMYLISFLISYLLKFIFKYDDNLGIYQYVIVFSNVGFMGYPVVEAVLGSEAIFYTAIFNLPFNLLTITLGSHLLSKDKNDYSFSIKLLINPIIISIFIGLLLFIFSVKLPIFLNQPIKMLGSITTPLSMLVIGSMLCASSAYDCFSNKKLHFVTLIRLILLPLLIYYLFKGQVEDSMILAIPIVISSMPAAANTAIMASEYKSNTALASQAVFFTTLFSIVTIPLISMFLLT